METQEYIEHLKTQLEFMAARISKDEDPQKGLVSVLQLFNNILESLEMVNSPESIEGIAKGLEMVLENEYFSQIRPLLQKQSTPNEESYSQPATAGVSVEEDMSDIDTEGIPPDVSDKVIVVLKEMGASHDDIKILFDTF